MIDFFIKSAISLFALLLFYHLILEKEKMHQFNRFYLLFSLLFSFAIPFITIEIIEETIAPIQQTYSYVAMENLKVVEVKETIDYKSIILWSLYGLITSILLFRYIKNILRIVSNIKSNTIVAYKNSKLVLLEEETPPHTFLNYIFLNKTDYQNSKIEEELYTHELIHVTQKHTLDILFVEALKTVFWFNPLFIFYKKAIQLNHEFLADEKVVNSYDNVPFYQNLLLAHTNTNPTFALTSNLNYSITKKRFVMMTKNVSRTKVLLYKIALLPLFSGLIYFMCVESVAQEKSISPTKSATQTEKNSTIKDDTPKDKQRDAYYAGVQIIVNDCNKKTLINKKYEELTLAEKNRFLYYVPTAKISKNPTEKEFNSWKNEKDFAIWLDGKNIPNSELDKYTTKDIAYFAGSFIYKNARTKKHPQLHQYSLYTQEYFDKNLKDSHLKFYGKELRMTLIDKKDKVQPSIKTKDNNRLNEATEKPVPSTTSTAQTEKSIVQPAQTETINIQENEIYTLASVNEKPNFFGGIEQFFHFVGKNYKAPSQPNLKGKVYISFIIEKDGSLSNIHVIRDIGYGTGDEAIRVLKLSPKWTPGKMNGNPVRVLYQLPISIQTSK